MAAEYPQSRPEEWRLATEGCRGVLQWTTLPCKTRQLGPREGLGLPNLTQPICHKARQTEVHKDSERETLLMSRCPKERISTARCGRQNVFVTERTSKPTENFHTNLLELAWVRAQWPLGLSLSSDSCPASAPWSALVQGTRRWDCL